MSWLHLKKLDNIPIWRTIRKIHQTRRCQGCQPLSLCLGCRAVSICYTIHSPICHLIPIKHSLLKLQAFERSISYADRCQMQPSPTTHGRERHRGFTRPKRPLRLLNLLIFACKESTSDFVLLYNVVIFGNNCLVYNSVCRPYCVSLSRCG